jgi:hypothetical protein
VRPEGTRWLAGYNNLEFFDGKKMKTYPVSKLGTGEFVKLLKDIAVAPDGRVWVVTANSVATYDGSKWTYFEEGRGFDKNYYFEAIAVDTHGRVWVATTSDGLLTYDGSAWTTEAPEDYWMVRALATDATDRVWAGTYNDGVSVFDGQAWVTYDRTNSGLPSNRIKSIATDARGSSGSVAVGRRSAPARPLTSARSTWRRRSSPRIIQPQLGSTPPPCAS